MKTVVITTELSKDIKLPWVCRFHIKGWAQPAGEVYDLKNGQYLALCNSCSCGYSRRVCKGLSSSIAWIKKKLPESFPCEELVYQLED